MQGRPSDQDEGPEDFPDFAEVVRGLEIAGGRIPRRREHGPQQGEDQHGAAAGEVLGPAGGDGSRGLTPVPGIGAAGAVVFLEVAGNGFVALRRRDEMLQHPLGQLWRFDARHELSPALHPFQIR